MLVKTLEDRLLVSTEILGRKLHKNCECLGAVSIVIYMYTEKSSPTLLERSFGSKDCITSLSHNSSHWKMLTIMFVEHLIDIENC